MSWRPHEAETWCTSGPRGEHSRAAPARKECLCGVCLDSYQASHHQKSNRKRHLLRPPTTRPPGSTTPTYTTKTRWSNARARGRAQRERYCRGGRLFEELRPCQYTSALCRALPRLGQKVLKKSWRARSLEALVAIPLPSTTRRHPHRD